jgi:hypothetical protein
MNKIKLRECHDLRQRFPFELVIDRNEKPAGRVLFNQTLNIRLLNELTWSFILKRKANKAHKRCH